MALRVCAEPNCPTLIPKETRDGRCDEHRRAKDRARGTRQERGYGADFESAKRSPEYVNATHCTSCKEPFTSDSPKTAGHRVAIRNGGRGGGIEAQCRRCNYGWLRTGL